MQQIQVYVFAWFNYTNLSFDMFTNYFSVNKRSFIHKSKKETSKYTHLWSENAMILWNLSEKFVHKLYWKVQRASRYLAM